ncbi:threonine-phosphate decarboxylase CobD [Sporosarcina pasteurii]|uniref:threonine-phosphate decarboxylase n=1 Tax=Sporosarcina pasteurii TaxID=1474 RepID=A0A380BCB1_SPOPA|nr:threonine-phosphate decarboxylase CobD [Sporosarcina pasteurii]MDS9472315.1 threonine-phosphate decarboxylase CobD [Sporosarcina pasteurii]QBQ06295.1 threonine-phosphate decarboxylase [Sporosarcina pasteurii]SUI99063.1 Threonine-phosphate decarboxylase [Sporosarcina pasteurii]
MQLPEHGANPHHLYERLGMPQPKTVLDFSENVNPFGMPERVVNEWPTLLSKMTAYPDPTGEPFLSATARFHQVKKDCVFVGNGAAELLTLLAERYRGKKAIVVHPTFSEYESTLRVKDVQIKRIVLSEENGFQLPIEAIQHAMENADVLYLCTPNNPTGILPTRDEITELIRHGKTVGCEIVLDEAFIDFVDEALSFIPEIKLYANLIVVRSMTKMYAIPGIRLGYVVAHPSVIEQIKKFAPHWNVNGIAASIGETCLKEKAFVENSVEHSAREREKLVDFLLAHECFVTESVANFLSFKLNRNRSTRQLYEYLLKRGIVLRHSENFLGMDGNWLRVGVKSEADMHVLKEELAKWFADN